MISRRVFDGPLILGAGLAGLSAALAAAPRRALVISPAALGEGCSSAWAQGGMAAALSADDSPALHAKDTIAAGAGLVDADAAQRLTQAAAETVEHLAALGAPFDRDAQDRLVQGLEAAHSRPRIARVKGDQAGAAIMAAVAGAARKDSRIEILEHARAHALLRDHSGRVRGALVEHAGQLIEVFAPAVILATGGLGGLYAVTTTPAAVRGEGVALAALAGAEIADAEFVQFHPTAIDIGRDPAPLASEALRGEGATLINRDGRRFMLDVDPAAELAPRDIVARAVHAEIVAGRGVFLDATRAIGDEFPSQFPGIFAACMSANLDPRLQPIPVAPAAHYHMGGVGADTDGFTSVENLFAAGECAATGVHGANRLASNSLLEAAAFGANAGRAARGATVSTAPTLTAYAAPELPAAALAALRVGMSRDVGVIRDAAGLERQLELIDDLEAAHGAALPLITARLVTRAALAREESRGGHYRSDFPKTAAWPVRSLQTITPVDEHLAAAE